MQQEVVIVQALHNEQGKLLHRLLSDQLAQHCTEVELMVLDLKLQLSPF